VNNFHRLLRHQITRVFGREGVLSQELAKFADLINETYRQFDEDRDLFERSLTISSQELFQANSYLQSVITSSVDGILAFDRNFCFTVWNPAMERITGVLKVDAMGKPAFEIVPFLVNAVGADFFSRPEREKIVTVQDAHAFFSKSGKRVVVEGHAAHLINERGEILGGIVIVRDVTERKRLEEEQRRMLSLLNATLESTTDGILVVDNDGKFVSFNQKFVDMWNLPPSVMASRDDRKAMEHVLDQLKDPDGFLKKVKELYAFLDVESQDFLHFRDGRIFERYSKPQKVGKEIVGRVWSFRDITQRKIDEERLNYLASFDSLTGLPNRTLFYDRLNQVTSRAARTHRAAAVLFLDLDGFKNINDTFGHDFGDLLLKSVAVRLKNSIREGDTVARLGGDEFVLILDALAAPDHTYLVAKKILDGLSKPFHLQEREIFITASMGIAVYPDDGENYETLVRNADIAMYRAKEEGKNKYQIYSPALNAKISERLLLENGLRHAVEREEFLLYYQPKIDLETGRIVGVEALIRWKRPACRQLIPAEEFITTAEEIGLILPIGQWVLKTACAQHMAWRAAGLSAPDIAVNLSAIQFQQNDLPAMIAGTLAQVGIDPKCLELEVAEGIMMRSAEAAEMTLKNLDALGVSIAIDDFGSGHTSLNYLKRFPVSKLKIDNSFVSDISINPDDKGLVGAIITLAHSLNLKVVAEGVETDDQLDYLRSAGCDQIQGNVFSPPLSVDQMTRLLIEGRIMQVTPELPSHPALQSN
jgi:diguanylate cyclase (GGDEF)-like protein/PAS domain S-box-containing protein